MTTRTKPITEEKLRENFDEIQREVAEQIRQYEESFPEMLPTSQTQEEIVVQPVFRYDVRAVS
ncbi:MAG: hypothetical protein DCC65_17960 [Planctomycetota bacterium]|nr:MAG: hypothetical protein DCC65_17960 [Planctomycetota bacterium]